MLHLLFILYCCSCFCDLQPGLIQIGVNNVAMPPPPSPACLCCPNPLPQDFNINLEPVVAPPIVPPPFVAPPFVPGDGTN